MKMYSSKLENQIHNCNTIKFTLVVKLNHEKCTLTLERKARGENV